MIIAHTDSRLEVETLERFLRAYQIITPLTIGELWAVAITLRTALVENLSRLASRMITSRDEREKAVSLADELLEMANTRPARLLPLMKKRFGKRKVLQSAFIEELTHQLRSHDLSTAPAYEWMESQMRSNGTSIEEIVQAEYHGQAASQVTVGNIITSMRLLSTIDWNTFFENVSLIDPLLKTDPANVFADMNFATRNRSREAIERIAKRSKADELTIARRVIELAKNAQKADSLDKRHSHIGYYLIDDGLTEFEQEFNYRALFSERFIRLILNHPTTFYLGSFALVTALLLALVVYTASYFGANVPLMIGFALLTIIPASELALSILNWDVTHLLAPRLLPQMETSSHIPLNAETMVVIPTLLTSEAVVGELLEKLEVYSLANQDENIYFALLGDFPDAAAEEMSQDQLVLEFAQSKIDELNTNNQNTSREKFYLFHRRRQWNMGEGKWMGWERKRGKLEEFNRLLRGAEDTSFINVSAEQEFLSQIKYVITLDSDTQLPRDTAKKLIGIATHPLNYPHFDEKLGRVTKGYGILQPRISISLTSASRSHFARIFSGNTGIDPYTTASSDIYQDLFCEGSFTGKGLYHVDAFQASLNDRVPENTILSHDLFEGIYARCGLVTDVELLDDFPTHFDSFSQRSHRWVRGDWQAASWIRPRVRNSHNQEVRNDLPLISRWKLLDNLRRSLVAPATFLWLIAIWTIVPGSPVLWTLFVLIALGFPVFAHLQMNLLTHPRGIPWTSHFWSVWGDARTNTGQFLMVIVALSHQAYSNTDAIIRTLYRQIISHQHLLEWKSAAQTERENPHGPLFFLRYMWVAVLLATISGTLSAWLRPDVLPIALPFILVWLSSPFIAYWVSLPSQAEQLPLSGDDIKMARMIARRTWRFFETFVGDEDNWLPPDNFQEEPLPKIAHRTSPTNIGLLLLSTISAHDFGYIGTLELTERLAFTFATLEKLERVRGHYLNWYDTQTLTPLSPRYISTVDSGNFAGHLLAVKQAAIEIPDRKLFDTRVMEGLVDSLEMMREEAMQLNVVRRRTQSVTMKQVYDEIETCLQLLKNQPNETPDSWYTLLESLVARTEIITDITAALAQEHGGGHYDELRFWSEDLQHQTQTFRRDIETFIPWKESDFSNLSEIISRNFPNIQQEWRKIMDLLNFFPSLSELSELYEALHLRLMGIEEEIRNSAMAESDTTAALNSLQILAAMVRQAEQTAHKTLANLNAIALQSAEIVEEMNFRFLLDEQRKVFSIGYSVDTEKSDNSFYDLLASESRLTSFIAIAKDEVPQEHWFRLGRSLTPVDSSRALISWTGTIFEYLMPILVMRDYDETLLSQTYKAIVSRQIEYGAENKVPWGISESAYNARDLQLNYQYQAFGIPGLGLKRGLSEDLVIAPYATALAVLVSPKSAMNNFRDLANDGALARFGFYESIDYTPERLPPEQASSIIRAFMAHHQGMILVALNNLVHANIMQKRFHAEPLVQATDLLLQERIPRGVPASHPRAEEVL